MYKIRAKLCQVVKLVPYQRNIKSTILTPSQKKTWRTRCRRPLRPYISVGKRAYPLQIVVKRGIRFYEIEGYFQPVYYARWQ